VGRAAGQIRISTNFIDIDEEEAMATQEMTIHSGRVREPGVLAATSLKFNLEEEIRQLEAEPGWQAGHTAKTIAKYPDFRVVLVVMKAGAQLVRHRTAGRISIQACRGSIRLLFSGAFENETVNMSAGDLVMLDREVAHDVAAVTNSAFLLTIAWPSLDPLLTGEILARAPVDRQRAEFVPIEDDRFLVTGTA
jgi:quercetin dioxygenase-like cupin family protein